MSKWTMIRWIESYNVRDSNRVTARRGSIGQKVPKEWFQLAKDGAKRCCELFLQESVEAVLAADETFLKFHEADSNLIVPVGVKRVGQTANKDVKDGCTLMVTMDMTASQLIQPLIIFKGAFGGTLMKRWSSYTKSTVLFTQNHWQTSKTTIIYLQSLWKIYSTKHCIGLVWDKAPSHLSEEVQTWVRETNLTELPRLVIDFVDAGLTSIYQPPDVSINKPLKDHIRKQYEKLFATKEFSPGSKVSVSREELVGMVEESYRKINQENLWKPYIKNSFELCGLNPWINDTSKFQNHLASLSDNSIYKSLLSKQTDSSVD